MFLYRKFGSHKLPLSKKILNYFGIFPLTNHYYEPVFNFEHLKKNLYKDRDLPGINFNLNQQINIENNLNQNTNHNITIQDVENILNLENIQNPDNIVPLWVNGGEDTRSYINRFNFNKNNF
jgi:hypothetical protein